MDTLNILRKVKRRKTIRSITDDLSTAISFTLSAGAYQLYQG
jgi:hypothetical protein